MGKTMFEKRGTTFSLPLHFLADEVGKGAVQRLLWLEVKVLIVLLANNHPVGRLPLLIDDPHVKDAPPLSPATRTKLLSYFCSSAAMPLLEKPKFR